MLSFFPRDVLGEILNLIESVSEGFPTYLWKAKVDKCANGCWCSTICKKAAMYLSRSTHTREVRNVTRLNTKFEAVCPTGVQDVLQSKSSELYMHDMQQW